MIRLVPLSRECLTALHSGKLEADPHIQGRLVNAELIFERPA